MITRKQVAALRAEHPEYQSIVRAKSKQHERLICTTADGERVIYASDGKALIEIGREEKPEWLP